MRAGQLCGPMGKVRTQRPPSVSFIVTVRSWTLRRWKSKTIEGSCDSAIEPSVRNTLHGDLRHHFYRRVEQRLLNHNHAGMVRVAKVELGMSEHR